MLRCRRNAATTAIRRLYGNEDNSSDDTSSEEGAESTDSEVEDNNIQNAVEDDVDESESSESTADELDVVHGNRQPPDRYTSANGDVWMANPIGNVNAGKQCLL